MKSKKIILIIMIAIVLFAGWLAAIKKVSGIDQRNAQNALVSEARTYAGKKLYVRAIPLFEKALTYPTEQSAEIEAELLEAYKEYGDVQEYISLIEKRASDGTAEEAEYIAAADYYLSRRDTAMAMALVKKGIERLGTENLKDYYEKNRYGNEIRITEYAEIIPTQTNLLMPAFDGSSWVYIDKNGRDAGVGVFDSAMPFNEDGYGVVSKNGTYYTILTNGDLYGVDEAGAEDVYGLSGGRILAKYGGKYSYYNYDFEALAGENHRYDEITVNHDGVAAVKRGGKWGIISDSGEVMIDFTLEDAAVSSTGTVFAGGAAMVKTGGSWYLTDTEGNKVSEMGFADAKAPESPDGLIAVANSSGKWGYIDRSGKLVIDYRYDDARSFSNALGAVKLGGMWLYISEQDTAVIDIGFLDAQPFHNGTAQARVTDGAVLITLDYFED